QVQRKGRLDRSVNLEGLVKLVAGRHHDENVHVAIGVRSAVCIGSKKNNLVRLKFVSHPSGEAADEGHGDVRATIPRLGSRFLGDKRVLRHASILTNSVLARSYNRLLRLR